MPATQGVVVSFVAATILTLSACVRGNSPSAPFCPSGHVRVSGVGAGDRASSRAADRSGGRRALHHE